MNTIRIPESLIQEVRDYLINYAPLEAAAYMICGYYNNSNGIHFTAYDVMYPEKGDYDEQLTYHLQVSAWFFNKVISRAEVEGVTVIICHSHPFTNNLSYSTSDDFGERASAKTLYECLIGKPCASLLFGQENIIGRIWIRPDKNPIELDQLRILGKRIEFRELTGTEKKHINEELYSRQILAFGKLGQEFLSRIKVGIVGSGGTGSCIAEQLTRLGVKDFYLVDFDKYEESNKTRIYGSTNKTEKTYKTSIIKKHLNQIENELRIKEIRYDVFNQNVLKILTDCDIIFSCIDKHTPRGVLNQLSYQYYIPVIDVGAGLRSDGNTLIDGSIRATLITPDLPCLFCREIINTEIIAVEQLPERERKERIREGYIRDFPEIDPSVISYTTTAAGMGINLFLNSIFGISENIRTNNFMDPINYDCLSPYRDFPECICKQIKGKAQKLDFFAPKIELTEAIEASIFSRIRKWIVSLFSSIID
jgi:hypothetical protein